jgi:hypothetical protein
MFTYLVKEKPSGNKRGPGIGKLLGEYKVPIVRRAPGDFQKQDEMKQQERLSFIIVLLLIAACQSDDTAATRYTAASIEQAIKTVN